jgi:hypothetical protein
MRIRTLIPILALILAALLPAQAFAGGRATLRVEVLQGDKGGEGTPDKLAPHAATLAHFEDFGDWASVGEFSLKLQLGEPGSKAVGDRALRAELIELTADRAKLHLAVVDPEGEVHRVTSSFGKGAQTVLASRSADGSLLHLFVVRADF